MKKHDSVCFSSGYGIPSGVIKKSAYP